MFVRLMIMKKVKMVAIKLNILIYLLVRNINSQQLWKQNSLPVSKM